MTLMKKLVLAATFALSASAFAQGLELGYPSTGGNGCPQGTVSANLSPDNTQLSILFDQFLAEAGPASGKTLDRKSCNISIPVTVPNGYSVSVVAVDYRGFVGLPSRKSNARFSEYFFANMPGPRMQRQFIGAQNTDYLIENDLVVSAVVWSACGAQTNLRINASIMLQNTDRYEDAIATVDSADISSGIIYQLQFRRCR